VDGVTHERSRKLNRDTMTALLDLGLGPNHQNNEGRRGADGRGDEGRNEAVALLVGRRAP
jgi:hypothetical protein